MLIRHSFIRLFSLKSHRHHSARSVIPVLAQINSLPSTEVEAAGGNGNRQKITQERRFEVSRHIIRPFGSVAIVRGVLRGQVVEMVLKINPHRRIGVLVEGHNG
jgi:hypothetical protein